ncbi:MAG TPA: GNAT family N-acetyltransferase [Dehalococcoidia bacterium]|nr:GNAT family N-acetyltransferase [Dehalococcoidia bacterium]
MQGAAPGAGLSKLDSQLEGLLNRQSERLTFLHPAWLRTWLAEFGANVEPLVLTCGDGNLVGLAPLMRADDRLTFIGDASICDFMDVLVDPANADAAYDDLWSQLSAEDWTEIDLWGLMASSPTRDRVKAYAAQHGYTVEETPEAVSPRLDLPATWDDYLASLGKKDRHELRRKIRRLYESGASVDFDVLSTQEEVVSAMDDFLALHTQSRQDKTDFMTPEMESFFRRMASALAADGLVKLFMLRINGKPAATVLCFDAGSHLYLYNSGYDPEFSGLSVGLVSKALVLQWAIENGMSGLDFLRGDEPYKYDLGAKDQQIYTLRLTRPA